MLRRAFTLIELLVVIAIIAILAAILFPVFAQAKAASKKALNVSNLKQIALATQLYVNDSDDTMVPYSVLADGPASGIGSGNMWWHGYSFRENNGWSATYVRSRGLLLPYTKSPEIQDCPVGKNIATPFIRWLNGELVPAYGTNTRLWVQPSATVPPVNLSQMEESSNTVLLVDSANVNGNTLWKSIFISPTFDMLRQADAGVVPATGFSSPRLHGRHQGKACVAWADGHVSSRTPIFRPLGTSPDFDRRRAMNVGELAPVPLPAQIFPGDPNIPQYNYFWSLNKATGN